MAFCLLDGGLSVLGRDAPDISRVSHSTHTYLPAAFPLALIEYSICALAGRRGLPSYSTSKGCLPIARPVAFFSFSINSDLQAFIEPAFHRDRGLILSIDLRYGDLLLGCKRFR